jgi:hypothetical protein
MGYRKGPQRPLTDVEGGYPPSIVMYMQAGMQFILLSRDDALDIAELSAEKRLDS